MPAHAVDHDLRHRVEAQLARLCEQHVAHAHEKIGHIHGGEDVLVAEDLYAADVLVLFQEGLCRLVVVEVRLGQGLELGDVGEDGVPDLEVVAGVDKQRHLARAHLGQEVADDVLKELLLRARAADGEEIAPGLALGHAVESGLAVGLDVLHELMVDVVAHVKERALGHGLELALLVHAAQHLVADERRRGLHRVDAALAQMQGHGPVVGDSVHHPGKARVDGGLGGPCVGCDIRHVFRQISEQRGHELRVFLVARVVGQLAEALVVDGLPDEFVEKPGLLADARAEGVEIVLPGDDLGGGGLGVGVEVQPVGLVAQSVGGRGDGHGDAVVAVAHADVADDEGVVGQLQPRLVRQHEGLDSEVGEHRVFDRLEKVIAMAVVAVFFDEFCLLPDRFGVVSGRDVVAENGFGTLHKLFPPYNDMIKP